MNRAEIVESLTDVIVELTPGDRELAERIAGAVWPLVVEAQASALVEASRSVTEHFDDLATMKRIGPVGVNDEYLAARARSSAFSESLPSSKGYLELMFARDYCLSRAKALSGAESHGGDSVPDRSTSAGDRRTGGLSGNQRLRDNNMWAFGYEAGYVAGQREERAREKR